MVAPSITQSQIQTVLGDVLQSILPGIDVVAGQANRVSEPSTSDFIVMWPGARERLGTNITVYADCTFIGSASGTALTVTAVQGGTIANGAPLFWPVAPYSGLTIAYQNGGGTGGPGVYTLSGPLSIGSGPMAAGQAIVTQPAKITFQLDFHSAVLADSSDMIAAVTTLFRSEQATTESLFDSEATGVWPLWADDAKQLGWTNAEQQWETKWTLDAHLECNQSVPWPQQFSSQLTVSFVQADA
jgi:hypothetical protein